MSQRKIFVLYIIDFRKFEFGYTAFMHFPLLHKALSSKKRMKSNEGEEFTHTKARTLSTLTKLFKKTSKRYFGYSQVSSALPVGSPSIKLDEKDF